MCDKCIERREEMWTEIRDLLNYNRRTQGPLSSMLKEGMDEVAERHEGGVSDEEIREAVDAMRANLIAIRCAFIARSCPHTDWHGMPPSMVLGAWAGEAMRLEQTGGFAHELLARLFGDF